MSEVCLQDTFSVMKGHLQFYFPLILVFWTCVKPVYKNPTKCRLYYQTSWTFHGLSGLKWYQNISTLISIFQSTFSPFSMRSAAHELVATTSCIHPANLAPFHGHESFTARLGALWMCASHLFLASSLSRKRWLLSLGFSCSQVPAELWCHQLRCCCGAFPIS